MSTQHTPDPRDVDTAARILGQAFCDYPVFTATLTDPLRRQAALPLTFRSLIRQFAPRGGLDLLHREGEPVGAALWADGTQDEAGLLVSLRSGQLSFALAAGLRDAVALMRVQKGDVRVHREIIREPHAYLLALAVAPGHQGTGAGSELLERGLARVDEAGLPAYLETNLPQNVRLYRCHGFVVVREGRGQGYDSWYMLRPAR